MQVKLVTKRINNYRYENLEGLRGLAALMVVVFHSLYLFFPFMMEGDATYGAISKTHLENFFYGNPLSVFFSGGFAVTIFFVLSGFVLSVSYMRGRDDDEVRKLALKRYLRLMPPAAVSIAIAYILLSFGLMKNQEAATIMGNQWLGGLWNFTPNIFEAMYQAFIGAYTTGQVTYNSVLWTMQYEFLGSFLIFGTLLLFGKLKIRWLVYVVLALFLWKTWYFGFVLGAVLAELHTNKSLSKKLQDFKYWPVVLIAGLLAGGYPKGPIKDTFYNYLHIGLLGQFQNFSFWLTIGAVLVVLCALYWRPMKRVLSTKYLAHFGKLTYSLYLTHKLILVTVTSYMVIILTNRGFGLKPTILIVLPLSFALMYVIAYGFTRYVDVPSIRLARNFCKTILKRG